MKSDAELFILDPKNADLADLGTVMPHVYSQKEEISACVEDFYERMIARSKAMKEMPNYKPEKIMPILDFHQTFNL